MVGECECPIVETWTNGRCLWWQSERFLRPKVASGVLCIGALARTARAAVADFLAAAELREAP
jgi:hypothetical protein